MFQKRSEPTLYMPKICSSRVGCLFNSCYYFFKVVMSYVCGAFYMEYEIKVILKQIISKTACKSKRDMGN